MVDDGIAALDPCAMEIFPIHFDVPGHYLPLNVYIETAAQTEAVIAALNDRYFDGILNYKILVLPPEAGSFTSRLAILVAFVALLDGDIAKRAVRLLTGHEPADWMQMAIERVQDKVGLIIKAAEAEKAAAERRELIHKRTEAMIIAEATRSLLQNRPFELRHADIQPIEFREAYEARNAFYLSCLNHGEIRAIGFCKSDDFPIKRSDFYKMLVTLPPKEEEFDGDPWTVEFGLI